MPFLSHILNSLLLTQALEHYDRMISWAETQEPEKYVSYNEMKQEIGEHWYGGHCPYCNYFYKEDDLEGHPCRHCPLTYDPISSDFCCNCVWFYLSNAITWKEWVMYAKMVKLYIEVNG